MSRADKRVEAMKQHPKNVRPEELEAVLLAAGFTFRQQGSSHRVYRRGGREILVVPQHRPFIKAAYVRGGHRHIGEGGHLMVATAPSRLDVERYLALPYRIELTPDDGEWVASMPELPGCLSQGETVEEALAMIREGQRLWIEVALEDDIPVPEPGQDDHRYTGKFMVRVPRDLHRALVAAAEAQNVSLNLFIATALARAVGQGPQPDGR